MSEQVLSDQGLVDNLRAASCFNFEYLRDNHGVTEQVLNDLFKLAKLKFDCGQYEVRLVSDMRHDACALAGRGSHAGALPCALSQ